MILVGNFELFPFKGPRRCYFFAEGIDHGQGLWGLTKLINEHNNGEQRLNDLYIFYVNNTGNIKILSREKEGNKLITLLGESAISILQTIGKYPTDQKK